jgi:hypothetical protein
MDLNQARILIAQMQACFKELGVPFVNESEILNQVNCTDTIMFRSWLSKNGHLAEVVTSLFIEPNIFEVSMNYREEIDRLNESDLEKLFNLLNAFNNFIPGLIDDRGFEQPDLFQLLSHHKSILSLRF